MRILTIILTLCYISVTAQEVPKKTIESVAGQHLIDAGNYHTTSIIVGVLGAGVTGAGLYLLSNDRSSLDGKVLTGIGGAIVVVGFTFHLSSFGQIKKAGKKLQGIE